jgi:hypothetical protein
MKKSETIKISKEQAKKFFACLRVFLREEKRFDRNHIAFIIAKNLDLI